MRFLVFCLFAFTITKSENEIKLKLITPLEIEETLRQAEQIVNQGQSYKENFIDFLVVSPEARNQLPFCTIEKCSDQSSLILETATVELTKKYHLNKEEIEHLSKCLRKNSIGEKVEAQCVENRQLQCTSSSYRTYDGSCNNLKYPSDGKAGTCYKRCLPAVYSDGIQGIRQSVKGGPLPEPRYLSIELQKMPKREVYNVDANVFHMCFGQFVDHDKEVTSKSLTDDDKAIKCCADPENMHVQCLVIKILPDDPVFKNMTCMEFVRDASCVCSSSTREHTNLVSAVLDCSHIYGANETLAAELRVYKDGKLKSQIIKGEEMASYSAHPATDQCSRTGYYCFHFGDARANQNVALITCHTIFLRYHNYIATELKKLCPNWNDEKIFQEARRIVIAIFERCVYEEYLPIVIGSFQMNKMNLTHNPTKYKDDCSPAICNSMAASVFRFGHTLVPDVFKCISGKSKTWYVDFKDTFFDTTLLHHGDMNSLISGMTIQLQENFDCHFVKAVTEFLYRTDNFSLGLDLVSININRGRDHGLSPYYMAVEICLNYTIRNFSDLVKYGLMDEAIVQKLQSLYQDVKDIDLFVGGLCENPVPDGIVGPTFACLIAYQFYLLKYCDRYFYTHENQDVCFTKEQRKEIGKTTLANIICTITNMTEISKDVFRVSSGKVQCSKLKRINLTLWKDRCDDGKPCSDGGGGLIGLIQSIVSLLFFG